MSWELKSSFYKKRTVLFVISSRTDSPVRFAETVRLLFPFANFRKNKSGSEIYALFPAQDIQEMKLFIYSCHKYYGNVSPFLHRENVMFVKVLWSPNISGKTHAITP